MKVVILSIRRNNVKTWGMGIIDSWPVFHRDNDQPAVITGNVKSWFTNGAYIGTVSQWI
jgi:hypothetical protein